MKEMKKQEAMKFLEKLTEEQLVTVTNLLQALTTPTTPEQKEKAKQEREEHEAKVKAYRKEAADALKDYRKKLLKGYEVPDRLNLATDVISEIVPLMSKINPDTDSTLTGIWIMYDYGVKRGITYQKNQEKRKSRPSCCEHEERLEAQY